MNHASGSSSGAPADTSGVPGDKLLKDLETPEAAQFCDWGAAVQGGYGNVIRCDGGTIHAPTDQASCVQDFSTFPETCLITVQEMEACTRVMGGPNGCTSFSAPECAPFFACVATP